MLLSEAVYVFFDFEATYHSSVGFHEIIEIGALKAAGIDFEIIDRFETLVKPSTPINKTIIEKTGITDSMTAASPGIQDVWEQFREFCEGTIMIGHKVSFDKAVIEKTAAAWSLKPFSNLFLDTYTLIKQLEPGKGSYSLEYFKNQFHLTVNSHRACDDAYVTCMLFKDIMGRLRKKYSFTMIEQVDAYSSGYKSLQKTLF